MNKTELVDAIAKTADVKKADAEKILNATISVISKNLKKAGKIQIIGFGSFEVRQRTARTGRNPQTGATIKIKASKSAAFVAGKALKEAVN
jgi:DNA-binding protein HU-beta